MRSPRRRAQSGSAILTAMLTVTLVATLATQALWQQWRTSEIEAAERSRLQARWILAGALDWARLILREDARQNTVDHLSEPWAVPLAEARLSTFLAASQSGADAEDIPGVFLSGHITDLQSRLNVNNLVQSGVVDPGLRRAFSRLFSKLGVDSAVLEQLITQLQLAQKAANATTTGAPLVPGNFEQLAWMGLSTVTLERLRPYVTLLPQPTPVNLNTAPAEVVYAAVNGLDWSMAQHFVQQRNQQHLTSLSDFQARSGSSQLIQLDSAQHAVSSRFFEVRATLRNALGTTNEVSVIQRDGMETLVLSRQLAL